MVESRGAALRAIVEARAGTILPGAANALAARIIEDLGFRVVYISGAGIANTWLGSPDIGLIGLGEIAAHTSVIRDAVNLPLVVDADTGFGNAINTRHAVRTLERAGANAIQLEDQLFPKRCGHFAGKSVIATAEMVAKVKAAVDARDSGDFLVIARTDARADHGFGAAVERCQAYVEAGADITFLEAPTSVEELAAIPRSIGAPQIVNLVVGGRTPILPTETLAGMGFALVLYANVALQAAIAGMTAALSALRDGCDVGEASGLVASFAERQRLVRKPLFDQLEAEYALKPGGPPAR